MKFITSCQKSVIVFNCEIKLRDLYELKVNKPVTKLMIYS